MKSKPISSPLPTHGMTRRAFLLNSTGALAGAALAGGSLGAAGAAVWTAGKREFQDRSAQAPALPVAVLRCLSYEPQTFRQALAKSFDLIGGIQSLVRDRTVTVKLNLTGLSWKPVFGLPAQETYQTQPNTVAALCALLTEAGARRVVLVENLYWDKPFEQVLIEAGWDVKAIQSAGDHRVSFEDTRNRGAFPGYTRFKVPWGGFLYPAFDLNQRFGQTDVLVSLAKLKQHATAGITGAVKNCFGNTPTSLYGDTAPDEKGLIHRAVMFHGGDKAVPAGVPAELDHGLAKEGTIRVPYITADIFGARPCDLNIVEGVRTIRGGEGHWNDGIGLMEPKVLIVGRNGVCTDSVGTAVMGFDPQAADGHAPFPGTNHLRLLASVGVGANDLRRIEVRGVPIKEVLCPFQPARTGAKEKS
jgi:uncharacterized protein (DUF362 family)